MVLLRGQLCALLPTSRQIMRKWKFLRLISGSLETVAMVKIAVLLRKKWNIKYTSVLGFFVGSELIEFIINLIFKSISYNYLNYLFYFKITVPIVQSVALA